MRSNPLYYISPSDVSITPNAYHNDADFLSVYIQRGTKIKVYVKDCPGLDYDNNDYRQWTLQGRNRRLNGGDGPYTIYARLNPESTSNAYLVFAPMQAIPGGWQDKYTPVNELTRQPTDGYWWVKLGTVSQIINGQRTIELDTGILGTQEYNDAWQLQPDNLPFSVVIDNSREANPPYVKWDTSIELQARLVQGWDTDATEHIHHWTIERKTVFYDNDLSDDDADDADEAWNNAHNTEGTDLWLNGTIRLWHTMNPAMDDFNGSINAVFILTAWGHRDVNANEEADEPERLAQESITIQAEADAKYELELSSYTVNYSPSAESGHEYQPEGGIDIRIRAIAEDGAVSLLDSMEVNVRSLHLFYDEHTDIEHELAFDSQAVATLPVSVFRTLQRSVNLSLLKGEQAVSKNTVAFIKNGEAGTPGSNSATLYLYKRVSGTIPSQTGISRELYYRFAERKLFVKVNDEYIELTEQNAALYTNGWSPVIPTGTDAIYITAASAYSTENEDNIPSNEWATPAKLSGSGGTSAATIFLYQRYTPTQQAPLPLPPSGNLTYTFATGELTGSLGDWSVIFPDNSGNNHYPCYVIQATALGAGETDVISSNEWSEARKMVEDGDSIVKNTEVKTDRGQWQQNPTSIYDGQSSGIWVPDGSVITEGTKTYGLYVQQLARTGGKGIDRPVSTGDIINEPYHFRTFTKNDFLAIRLSDEWSSLSDAEIEKRIFNNEIKSDFEISRAWRNSALWECLVDGTVQEPWFGCTDWQLVSGGTYSLPFYSDEANPVPVIGLSVRPAYIDENLVPYLLFGQEDISSFVTSWRWERESRNAALDEAWNNSARVDPDDPTSPKKSETRRLHITTDDLPSDWYVDNGRVGFRCTATFTLGLEETQIINMITII